MTEEQKKRLDELRKRRPPRPDGLPRPKPRRPTDTPRRGGKKMTPEEATEHARKKMAKIAEAWRQGKESVEEMTDLETAATQLFERRKQLQEEALRIRRLRQKAREEAAKHGSDEMDFEERMNAAAADAKKDAAADGKNGSEL